MQLSQNQRAELKDRLSPLLTRYFEHQGWPSIDAADTVTMEIISIMRDLGVHI